MRTHRRRKMHILVILNVPRGVGGEKNVWIQLIKSMELTKREL